jgi:hypothetical protein
VVRSSQGNDFDAPLIVGIVALAMILSGEFQGRLNGFGTIRAEIGMGVIARSDLHQPGGQLNRPGMRRSPARAERQLAHLPVGGFDDLLPPVADGQVPGARVAVDPALTAVVVQIVAFAAGEDGWTYSEEGEEAVHLGMRIPQTVGSAFVSLGCHSDLVRPKNRNAHALYHTMAHSGESMAIGHRAKEETQNFARIRERVIQDRAGKGAR